MLREPLGWCDFRPNAKRQPMTARTRPIAIQITRSGRKAGTDINCGGSCRYATKCKSPVTPHSIDPWTTVPTLLVVAAHKEVGSDRRRRLGPSSRTEKRRQSGRHHRPFQPAGALMENAEKKQSGLTGSQNAIVFLVRRGATAVAIAASYFTKRRPVSTA